MKGTSRKGLMPFCEVIFGKTMNKYIKTLIILCFIFTLSITCVYADTYDDCTYKFFGTAFESGNADMDTMMTQNQTDCVPSVYDEEHGKSVKMLYTTANANYCGPEYEIISDSFQPGELKKVVISFDLLFEDYAEGEIRILSNEQTGSSKNGFYAISFTKNGVFHNNAYGTDFTRINYSLNTWYNFKIGLDLENQIFSLWVNDNELTSGTAIKADNNAQMKDFLHARVRLSKNTVAGDSAKNVYLDNFTYHIPLYYAQSETGISLVKDSNKLKVLAASNDSESAVFVAAQYEDGEMLSVDIVDTENINGSWYSEYITDIISGIRYEFFLIENWTNIKPLTASREYYSYDDEDYEFIKDKWQEFLVGRQPDMTSEPIQERVNSIYNTANNLLSTMRRSATQTSLWGASYTSSAHLGTEYGKIYKMALAYGTQGQPLYQSEELYEAIIYALDWMYENRYGQAEIDGTGWRDVREHNWWDWFVSAPGYLVDTMMIIHEDIEDEDIDRYLSLYTYLKTIMRTDLTLDSNVNSWAYNAYAAAVLQRDEDTISMLTQAYNVLFEITKSGTGMYEDYSYVKHNMMAYTGQYGTEALLGRVVKVMSITGDTLFELPQVDTHMYENWIFNAFEPLMYNAGIMTMVRGRAADGGNEYDDGVIVLESILNMIDVVSDEDAYKLKMLIKRHFKGDRLSYAYTKLTLPHIIKLDSIVNDETLPEPEPYELTKVYYHMDRAVHHKDDWSFGLSMSSSRIANYESINGNNEKGWYTGDGMTYLYTEPDQYNADYFEFADPYKRPGTTVDSQTRQAVSVAYGQEYFSSKDFVGGVSMDDSYAVVAMDLESFHNDTQKGIVDTGGGGDQPLHDCDLTADKSWYLFENEIVCLGAGINATANYEVSTIVENRMINSQDLVVNGANVAYGTNGSTTAPSWAHIENTAGYYFPSGGVLNYKQVRNTRNFFEMWFSHGNAPTDGTYAYAILPKMTANETQAYANNPKFEILSNTSSIQAVKQIELGITGYTFRTASAIDGISVSAPCTLMKKQTNSGLELCMSDPTHKLSTLTITLNGEYSPYEYDSNLSVSSGNGKTIITANLSGETGKTFKVKLN